MSEDNIIEEALNESGKHGDILTKPEVCENQMEAAKKALEHENSIPKNEKHLHNIIIYGENGSHRCTCGKAWEVK